MSVQLVVALLLPLAVFAGLVLVKIKLVRRRRRIAGS
jgi:hypothetical protein